MGLKIGIVGLPNVGKSTLFNALLKRQQALVANYPFATIEPNVGVVEVPDERLQVLAKMSNSQKIVPATVEFVDIAGLVAGAGTSRNPAGVGGSLPRTLGRAKRPAPAERRRDPSRWLVAVDRGVLLLDLRGAGSGASPNHRTAGHQGNTRARSGSGRGFVRLDGDEGL